MSENISPYKNIPPKSFWAQTAAVRDARDIEGFFVPKFEIRKTDKVVTAGSCFAQHVGRALRQSGYNVLDVEPLPPVVPQHISQKYGYGMYSARYGNIYTSRQLRQLICEAFESLSLEDGVWERNTRFYDAQRPNVEPGGYDTPEEVIFHRNYHLACVRRLFEAVDVFVFTFGLTEAWCSRTMKTVYPTAPGTIAGSYDPMRHVFHNFSFKEIIDDFMFVRNYILSIRPHARFVVTVSPVPLTATATNLHVEVATCQSKSILRAVCSQLYSDCEDVDYYPSYEIITAQAARGCFYQSNLRTVSEEGVETAMRGFLHAHGGHACVEEVEQQYRMVPQGIDDDVVCEDVLLEEFLRK